MQIIHQDEDEESGSRRANSIGIVIYIERVSKCMEGKYIRRLERRIARI